MSAILTLTMNPAIDVSASTNKVAPIRKIRCSNAQRDPGGGGINVARVVHRFGGDSQALYPAGGLTGRLLHRLLNDEGVANVPIDVAESTRENFSITETTSGDQYRFTLPGAVLREQEWPTCLDRVAALTPPPDYLVASGSLPPGVPVDFYARLARIAGKFGARVVVDTSGPPLAAALEAGVYLVKPNLRELRVLTGLPLTQPSDWEAAAAGIVRSGGADIVALTLGDAGATLVSRDACIRASPLFA
jgi:6-phosphofructokinase 2